jgi:hypothetical protein
MKSTSKTNGNQVMDDLNVKRPIITFYVHSSALNKSGLSLKNRFL